MGTVILDGMQISTALLHRKMEEASTSGKKIVEVSPGVFKTLEKMEG